MAQVPDSDEWEYRESPSLTVYDDESNPVIGCVLGPGWLRAARCVRMGAVPVRFSPFEEPLVLAARSGLPRVLIPAMRTSDAAQRCHISIGENCGRSGLPPALPRCYGPSHAPTCGNAMGWRGDQPPQGPAARLGRGRGAWRPAVASTLISQVGFTVVGSGPNGANPHHEIGERVTDVRVRRAGELVHPCSGSAASATSRRIRRCSLFGHQRFLAVGVCPVGFQNSAMASDQRFQAAGSYWLIRPPRTGRRRILPLDRLGDR